MEKPPQEPAKKMQITQQEFVQESKRGQSYLSVLPADVAKTVGQYTFETLETLIYRMRSFYLNDPENKEAFLNDQTFNENLINQLADTFIKSDPSADPDIIKSKIALMLNTPASFKVLRSFPFLREKNIFGDHLLLPTLKGYLDQAPYNYPQALEYTQRYYLNVGPMRSLRYWIIKYLAQKFGSTFDKNVVPEIKVLIDDSHNFEDLRAIIDGWGGYSYSLHWRLNNFFQINESSESLKALKILICNSLIVILNKALINNDHKQIQYILKGILNAQEPDKIYAKCFIEHFKGELGKRIITYLMAGDEHVPYIFERTFWPTEMVSILWDWAIHTSSLATKRLLYCTILDWMRGSETFQPLSFVFSRQIQQRNQFLLDLVQSPYANAENIRFLIEKGADINHVDSDGVTILMHAIQSKNIAIIDALLSYRYLNKNACDQFGHNALWYARNLETDAGTRLAIIELLQQAGTTEEAVCVMQ